MKNLSIFSLFYKSKLVPKVERTELASSDGQTVFVLDMSTKKERDSCYQALENKTRRIIEGIPGQDNTDKVFFKFALRSEKTLVIIPRGETKEMKAKAFQEIIKLLYEDGYLEYQQAQELADNQFKEFDTASFSLHSIKFAFNNFFQEKTAKNEHISDESTERNSDSSRESLGMR